MAPEVAHIHNASPEYPAMLRRYLGNDAPDALWALGNLGFLRQRAVALFCSVKCPGDLILKTYDLARALRDKEVMVMGGFHSPMEKECLELLLRGKQPVIACHARRLSHNRLPSKLIDPLNAGRLLMISPFDEKVSRATADTASTRNEFVAALADRVFVAYAAPGSKTEALCGKILKWQKPLLTFASKENSHLISLGATPCGSPDDVLRSIENGYGEFLQRSRMEI